MSATLDLSTYIRSIPNFPKPGIMFRDITPLLAAPEAFREVIRRLAAHFGERGVNTVLAAEARVAVEALRRRDQLDDAERVRLFAELAAHFRAYVEFPESALVGLTDEQYVRNVVDSLFAVRERAL